MVWETLMDEWRGRMLTPFGIAIAIGVDIETDCDSDSDPDSAVRAALRRSRN
jgi:hypothetical protein